MMSETWSWEETPEIIAAKQRRKLSRRTLAASAAVLTCVGLGAGVATDRLVLRAGQEHQDLTQQTRLAAEAQAMALSAALYDQDHYKKAVLMRVINGEISTTVTSGDDTHTGVCKDPILLSTGRPSAPYDSKGKFLVGSYIGVQGNDGDGNIIITPVKFDKHSMAFTAYDAGHIIFDNLGAYVTTSKIDDGGSTDSIVGYDVTGQTDLANSDGSFVRPGWATGMK